MRGSPAHRAEAGQIAVVLPLILALVLASAFMWKYLTGGSQLAQAIVTRQEIGQIVQSAMNRTRFLLEQTVPTDCDNGGAASINAILANYRNLGCDGPSASGCAGSTTKTWQIQTASTPASSPLAGCVVFPEEYDVASTYGSLASLKLEVSRSGTPDLQNLSSIVTVTVSATSRQQNNEQIRNAQQSKAFSLRVATLSQYALVLMDGSSQPTPWLLGADGSELEVLGSVYWGSLSSQSIDKHLLPGDPTHLTISGSLDVRNSTLPWDGMATWSRSPTSVTQSIRGGIRTGILGSTIANYLPYEDNGPDGNAWRVPASFKNTSYENVAGENVMKMSFQPRVDMHVSGTPTPTGVSSINPQIYYAQSTASYFNGTKSPPATFAGGDQLELPYPGAGIYYTDLWDTCRVSYIEPGSGQAQLPPSFVLMRDNEDIRITFDAMGSSSNVFCAMIAANNVIASVPAGTTAYFVGNVIAKSFVVEGGGKLVLINPHDTTTPPTGLVFPAAPVAAGYSAQTLAGVSKQFRQLASGPAHNFFVPVWRVIPAISVTAAFPWRPHGPLIESCTTAYPCKQRAPKVGYMFLCDVSRNFFCLFDPLTPPTDDETRAALFTTFADQLAYSAIPLE